MYEGNAGSLLHAVISGSKDVLFFLFFIIDDDAALFKYVVGPH